MKFKKTTAVLMLFCIMIGSNAIGVRAEDRELVAVVYQTADIDGYLNNTEETIGADILAAMVKENAAKTPATFLFDSGDAFGGNFFVNMDKGDNAVSVMNAVGYDGMVLGNHDLDYGFERTKELARAADFSIFAQSSIADENSPITSYELITRGDITLGVFGITGPAAKLSSVGGFDLEFLTMPELVAYATNTAALLRAEGADIVVCLTHIGTEANDVKGNGSVYDIAKGARGIDVILDGNKTEEITPSPGMIPVSMVDGRGAQVGEIKFYRENDVITTELGIIEKSDTIDIAPDSTVATVLIACQESADRTAKTVVAVSPVSLNDFEKEVIRSQESVIADMVADAMRAAAEADIAFCNAGNIRGPIGEGKVTLGTISNVLPYANIIMVADVKGSVIRKALEYSASLYGQNDGGFMQVSGCVYAFDPLRPEGERLLYIKVAGKPLDDEKTYTLTTFDFIAEGGDGYTMLTEPFANARAAGTGDITTVFADYLTNTENPLTETQNRIVIIPGGEIKPDISPKIIVLAVAGVGVIILLIIFIRRNIDGKRKIRKQHDV